MNSTTHPLYSRRKLLTAAGYSFIGNCALTRAFSAGPVIKNPRATSGDTFVEPNWDKRLTITIGNRKADLVGDDEKVIQAAVDWAARQGGGTVKILPGTYKLRNAVHLS